MCQKHSQAGSLDLVRATSRLAAATRHLWLQCGHRGAVTRLLITSIGSSVSYFHKYLRSTPDCYPAEFAFFPGITVSQSSCQVPAFSFVGERKTLNLQIITFR